MPLWHCLWLSAFMHLVWSDVDLALSCLEYSIKPLLEKPSTAYRLYHTPGWLLPQGSWHLLKVTRVLLLTLCSTSPLQSRLPGAIGIEHRPKSALLALYQGITQGMLQATSLPLLLSPLCNLKDSFPFS